ncbi:DUF2017 family protein [Falsarthrobacter nasiphocae]|uniref:DUF2017 domain-containing protein n=1 Tax=Falsarthrobacter nasiphocae TaxID=189863 RepID=A0AAE4C8V6_9MICC|nr:DUF2017 family protein [Falsarthrobacter nasiphocae]MDR6892795.1 hypothetical protein [Falsarthrobacter nasiphocae]
MAERFRYRPGADGGSFVGHLERGERAVLTRALADVAELLASDAPHGDVDPLVEITGYRPDAAAPEDPALLALLPDASLDPDVAGEFRRLAHEDVRRAKLEDLARSQEIFARDSLRLSREEAEAASRGLNSVAIVLAARLGVVDEETAEEVSAVEDMTDTESALAVLYNFVGWLRAGLSAALIDSL